MKQYLFMEQGYIEEHEGTQIWNLKRYSSEQNEVSLILKNFVSHFHMD